MFENRLTYSSQLIIIVLMLLVTGVVMVYSSSSFKAQELHNDSHYFLKSHFSKAILGIVLALLVSQINYKFWLKISPLLLLLSFAGLLYLLTSPSITEVRGSKRWLTLLGLRFQPSDIARISLILFLGFTLGCVKKFRNRSEYSFLCNLGAISLIAVPIFLQPDAGTALLTTSIALMIMFISGERLRYLFAMLLIAVPMAYLYFTQVGYQRERILGYIASFKGEHVSWQLQQSFIAFANGNWVGVGLGSGRQKFHFLPDPFTDFIYAIIGEEFGLIGSLVILALVIALVRIGFKIAMSCRDDAGKILAIAIVLHIGVYAFANVAVVLNLLPTTGIPMPFISFGGTALIVNLFSIGVLLNVARKALHDQQLHPVNALHLRHGYRAKKV